MNAFSKEFLLDLFPSYFQCLQQFPPELTETVS